MRSLGRRPKVGAVELAYRRALRAALERFQRAILAALDLRTDSAYSEALRRIRRLRLRVDPEEIDKVARRTERDTTAATKRLIGIAPAVSRRTIERWRKENVDLIVRLQGSQLDRVSEILRKGRNLRVEELREKMEASFGIEKRHADLLARDQTLKLNAKITREQHTKAGVTKYRWNTSLDERVRKRHRELHDQVFAYDDPPIIDPRTGERGHPGDDYQCRCIAIPIIDWDEPDPSAGEGFERATERKRGRGMFDG